VTLAPNLINISPKLESIPEIGKLAQFLSDKVALKTYVFGGAVRDLLLEKTTVHDFDLLAIDLNGKITSRDQFNLLITEFASLNGLSCVDNPPYHLSLSRPNSDMVMDIHYPHKSVLSAVSRSDLTINGIVYNCQTKAIEDPLGGLADLSARKLRIHSPSCWITISSHLPRLFRVAAQHGFEIGPECLDLVKTFAVMAGLSDGRPQSPVLIELLRFLSLERIARYLTQFVDAGLLQSIIPELSPVYAPPSLKIYGKKNISDAEMPLSDISQPLKSFLLSRLGPIPGATELGFVRLAILLRDLGNSYFELSPKAPYIEGSGCKNQTEFARRMDHNLNGYLANRYRQFPEIFRLLKQVYIAGQFASSILALTNLDEIKKRIADFQKGTSIEVAKRALALIVLMSRSTERFGVSSINFSKECQSIFVGLTK
jgi:tRNA nucleotidyltransferase/poly(A) polymerase